MKTLLLLLFVPIVLASDLPDLNTAPAGSAYSIYLIIDSTKETKYHKWLSDQSASHKADVRIEINGVATELSFDKFECRISTKVFWPWSC